MHVSEPCELVERYSINEMHAQERTFLALQRGESAAERPFHLAAVSFRQIAELRIDGRWNLGLQLREAHSTAAAEINGSAHRKHAHPAAERASAGVFGDLAWV